MVGVPPSSSEAVAAQVSSVPTGPVLGLTEMLSMTGSVLVTVAEAVSELEPPSVSAAVAVQVMMSPGSRVDTGGEPQQKGPPGANLFVVRKMRKGEYDEFNNADLRSEFSKFGTVTRAEMTIDKETGWSKGFGFVSFASVQEADAALAQVHGSWMAGREMKVEKTRET